MKIVIRCITVAVLGVAPPFFAFEAQEADLEVHRMWHVESWNGNPFGLVVDVAPASNGGAYFLDEAAPGLVLLSSTGGHVASLIGKGRGPAEFTAPLSVAEDADGRAVVLDAGHGNLRWFRRENQTFVLDESWRPPVNARSFCLLGRDVVLVATSLVAVSPTIFHRFGPDRSLVQSFGIPAEEAGVPLAALADGRLVCLDDSAMILYLPDVYGKVFAFSTDGALLWATPLPDYTQMGVEAGTGWVRYTAGPEGYTDMGAAIAELEGRLIVQFGKVDRATPRIEEVAEMSSVIIDLDDGEIIGTSDELPRITAGSGPSYLYGYTNWPLPAAMKYREVKR